MEIERRARIGPRLRELRRSVGLTQAQLAERISVAQATVSDYENGKLQIDADELPVVAHALGVTVGDLFESRGTDVAISLSTEALMALLAERVRAMQSSVQSAESTSSGPAESNPRGASFNASKRSPGAESTIIAVATPRVLVPA